VLTRMKMTKTHGSGNYMEQLLQKVKSIESLVLEHFMKLVNFHYPFPLILPQQCIGEKNDGRKNHESQYPFIPSLCIYFTWITYMKQRIAEILKGKNSELAVLCNTCIEMFMLNPQHGFFHPIYLYNNKETLSV
jgi:hypothetical protein